MKKTRFSNCSIKEADFTQCVLTEASFQNCELSGSTFHDTNLEKADLRTASGFNIDPDLNRIKKAKFSTYGLAGLLGKYDIKID